MCGIVYSKSFIGKPVNKQIIKQYKNQRNRGSQGFGYFMPQLNVLYHNPTEKRAIKKLKSKFATEILFHHRLPTSTANVMNACHPFDTGDSYINRYIVVHNGIIFNDDDLYSKHRQQGIVYSSLQADGSYNDSEALAHDIAQYVEGKVHKLTAEGSIAFIAVQMSQDGTRKALYFGRNDGSPLNMLMTNDGLELSSEGRGEPIEPNTLYCMSYATGTITTAKVRIPEYSYSYSYSGTTFGYIDDDDDDLYSYPYSPATNTVSQSSINYLLDDYLSELYMIDTNLTSRTDSMIQKYTYKLYDYYMDITGDDIDYAIILCESKIDQLDEVARSFTMNKTTKKLDIEYYDLLDKLRLMRKVHTVLVDESELQWYNYSYLNQKGSFNHDN